MPSNSIMKIKTDQDNLYLRVAKGHFATAHAHTNYYIDVVAQKSRLSEAKAVARKLCSGYKYSTTIVDTIFCLDGTEVIGACLADELSKNDFVNINAHQSIYVVSPEFNNSQLMFRDNIVPMIQGKHVLILAVSVSSGSTVNSAIEAVQYYGGQVTGVASIFSTKEEVGGFEVNSVFDPSDLPDYFVAPAHECPLCAKGEKLDALVNYHGYSKLK
ncbi:MAG: orotate phosphoribosyltransferase [Oscillospiraceae bacterium]|nr:orotate phosphoribosyltransferase [Oscillospiraceae bacterium]